MEDKKKEKTTKEKLEEAQHLSISTNEPSEQIRISEIFLASSTTSINELVGLALALIENKQVMKYLEDVEKKKASGNYVG